MRINRHLLLFIAIVAPVAAPAVSRAEYPGYVLLYHSPSYSAAPAQPVPHASYGFYRPTSSYSYGWFGISHRRHPVKHYGWRGGYKEVKF